MPKWIFQINKGLGIPKDTRLLVYQGLMLRSLMNFTALVYFSTLVSTLLMLPRYFPFCAGTRGARGACAPKFLADQLTLYQPGEQIMPSTLLRAPSDFQTFLQP